ncbi:hypothetical protein IH981_02320, partial [Patescibacteria group bacterium]|nr:hypothetical protein [Patescibacteria group bacterium]
MPRKGVDRELFVAIFWSPFIGKVGYRGPAAAISSLNKVGYKWYRPHSPG